MTKKELIELLKDIPDETPIFMRDFESEKERSIGRLEFLKLISTSSNPGLNAEYLKLIPELEYR